MNKIITKISLVTSVAIALTSCSTINNMKGVKAMKSAFNANEEKIKLFKKGEHQATHIEEKIIGDSITIITPEGAKLEDHLLLGNRTFTFSDPGNREKRFTYITKTTPQTPKSNGYFSFTKTKCARQANHPFLETNEYIDKNTHCLMKKGQDLPYFGMEALYEGTYKLIHLGKSERHEINIKTAKSVHTVAPNIWDGSIILDMDDMATVEGFYDLFKRYQDDTMTFKFKDYTSRELQSAIHRYARHMNPKEKSYIKYVTSLAKGDRPNIVSPWVLDSHDGIISFTVGIDSYKNNGSILTLTPAYYPSAEEVGTDNVIVIDFLRKRKKILSMINDIRNE